MEVDRRRRDADRLGSDELHRLADRAEAHLRDVPRVHPVSDLGPEPIVTARWKSRGEILETFNAVMRFDSARDITLSELRVELGFPADERTASFFQSAAAVDD
jgi:hypothetical protein